MPSMTITIPPAKYQEFKKYILLGHPNHSDGSLTDDQWVKKVILIQIKNLYKQAKYEEWHDEQEVGPAYDEDIVEVT